jgi:hypothetical protein
MRLRRRMEAPGACGEARRNLTAALPPALFREVLRALPADQRARAACVSRAWRAAVADPAAWTRLDLSGMTCRVDDAAALLAAAARAHGRLEALDVPGRVTFQALLAVATANAASLRMLHGHSLLFDDS